MMRSIAVIDVGKTNAKLALVDLADLSEIAVRTRPNRVLQTGPYPQYDLEGHWQFFCDGLRDFQREFGVDGISITTHGAAATLIGFDGKALPMLDYECRGPDDLAEVYDAIRPAFAETGSPRLPMGLNLGAQLHWQFATDPSLRERVKHIVTYPQYWGHRLTGALACDLCSLGCHTDLWLPDKAQFSGLVDQLGIRELLAPPRRPAQILGGISAQVALETGLPAGLPVAVGIHDSNASLYPHLLAQAGAFSVVSTGTWVIMMAMRGDATQLDPTRDTLINVNGLGEPVPSARFMGGREFDMVNQGWTGAATDADRDAVYAKSIMLLPAVEPSSGPFAGQKMRWTVEPETEGQRLVALSNYLALMTHTGLKMIGAKGPCVVEGPFARNTDYLDMLASLCPDRVEPKTSATGTSIGAALLFGKTVLMSPPAQRHSKDIRQSKYANEWNSRAMSNTKL
jgi:sugar (pentulose or hexulose) kinase